MPMQVRSKSFVNHSRNKSDVNNSFIGKESKDS
jgi:hypothetical protein